MSFAVLDVGSATSAASAPFASLFISEFAAPLYPLHDVRLIEGKLDELMAMPYSEDYLWVTVHDELPPPDARVTLSVNFPNMMKFSIVNSRTKQDIDVLATQSMENKTTPELFSDFYRLQNNDQELSEAHRTILKKVLEELEGKA